MEAIIISNPQSQFNTQNNLPINLEPIITIMQLGLYFGLVPTTSPPLTSILLWAHAYPV